MPLIEGGLACCGQGEPGTVMNNSKPYAVLSLAVIVISLVVVAAFESPVIYAKYAFVLLVLDTLCCIFFWFEYFYGIYDAPNKKKYAISHFIDVIGAIPTLVALRWLRLIRFIRLIRVLRIGVGVGKLWRIWVKHLKTDPGITLSGYSILLVLLGAEAFYIVEHGSNSHIHTYTDAVWLALATLTSVGLGDLYPVTSLGRGIAIAIALLGIGLLASLTATIANQILESGKGEE
jgi:voltage-gated potassium channel